MQKSRQGFALVIVIWILTLLSLMAGSFAKSMRRDSSVTTALKYNAEALALTESGFGLAEYMLIQANPDMRWLSNGTPYRILRPDGSEIRISIVSEAGKIDINAASEATLTSMLKAVTDDIWQQQHLLNSILDWRDEDNEPRPQGAEKKQYQDAGLPYIPSNQPFQSLEELQMVLGMNETIFTRIQPWITVYSGQSEVNPNEATPEVLQIIGNDLQSKNTQNVAVQQGQTGNSPQQQNNQSTLGATNNENRTYTITVEVQMNDGAAASLEAVVNLQSQNFAQAPHQVLDWKQNQLTRSLFANDMESRLITVQDEFTIDN